MPPCQTRTNPYESRITLYVLTVPREYRKQYHVLSLSNTTMVWVVTIKGTWVRFNTKMLSYQHGDPHQKDNAVSRPSYLIMGIFIYGNGLYIEMWFRTLATILLTQCQWNIPDASSERLNLSGRHGYNLPNFKDKSTETHTAHNKI